MAATTAAIGMGVALQRLDEQSPGVYESVGEILEISGPSFSRDAVDATHTLSTDRYREFISGLRDAGEMSTTIALVPGSAQGARHRELMDDYESDLAVTYRMIFPDGLTNFVFSGLLTSLEHATPLDDRMTLNATFKISGKPVLAAALS